MQRNIQRLGLLGGLILFALLWTALMGLGVSGASPDSAVFPAADMGAGVHVMYVDDSQFPVVTVYLAVNDANGQVIARLEKESFSLREDGVAVKITDFIGAGRGASSTMLVIDTSGSMDDEDKMAGAIRAAQTYINLLKPSADRLGVITFSDTSKTLAPLGEVTEQGRTTLNSLLGNLFPLGGTQFYAATREGIKALDAVSGRKVVLALTDGMDNTWQFGLAPAVADAQAAKTPVYVVGLGRDVDRSGLERLARETGGRVYFSPGAAQLKELYGSIASDLRNEYALTYRSLTPNLDGTQRALEVAISTGGQDLQTDGGYVVGGVLASGLNLALFVPVLLVLSVALTALYAAPSLHRALRKAVAARAGAARANLKEKYKGEQAHPDTLNEPSASSSGAGGAPTQQSLKAATVAALVSAPAVSPALKPALAGQTAPLCLVVVYSLREPETVVGSAPNCALRLPAGAALQQARIHFSDGRYAVDDLAGARTTAVSYGGDPALLHPVQRNALRDGSLVQLGPLCCVFRQATEGASLEQRLSLPAGGLSIGTDEMCDVVLAAAPPQRVQVRLEGGYWLVERLAGECEVSFNGSPELVRPVAERNALRPGSLLKVGGVLLRLEPA